jgi:hypothetical protein
MLPSAPIIFTFWGVPLDQVKSWVEEKRSNGYFNVQEITDVINYKSLPRRYTGRESWPKSSNLKCWHCDIVIGDVMPKFIASNPSLVAGEINCDVTGAFNTWGCVVAYIDHHYRGSKNSDARNLTAILCSQIIGSRVTIIHPAPPKSLMSQYCGEGGLTADEYLGRILL